MREGYKKTALGEIPKDWEVKKLGNVSRTFAGGTPKRSIEKYYNGTIPWIKSGEVDNNEIITSSEFVTQIAINETSTRLIAANSILVALYGATAGKVGVLKIEACSNQAVLAINSTDDNLINSFIYHYLKRNTEQLLNLSQGSGQPNLSKAIIDNVSIPLPPLAEQEKIAEILSTVDEKIEVVEQKITETKELKKGLMQSLLTKGIGHTQFKNSPLGEIPESWEVKKLGDICDEIFLGLTSKVDYVEEGGYPFIRATDINTGKLSFNNVKYISETQHKKLTAKRITKKGDVLVSKSGTLGTCVIVDVDIKFSTYESIITIQPQVNLLYNKFLLQILQDTNVQKRMIGARVGGIVGHLNLMTFRKLVIPLPPLAEQEKIAEILSTVDEKLEVLNEKKGNYQELKKGLMQQLLTGNIRVV